MREEYKTAEVMLITAELMQDIKNEGWLQADAVEAAAGETNPIGLAEKKAALKDIGERVSAEKVKRQIDLAVDLVTDMLHPYSAEVMRHPTEVVTNRYKDVEIYNIGMHVPYNYPQTSINALRTLIHEYVVSSVMKEVVRIQMPSMYESWTLKLAECQESISGLLHRRVGLVRRNMRGWM